MLTLQNIFFTIGAQPILSNINLNINAAEMVMILGSNGSGKSSLFKLIDRRYITQQGKITINSEPVEHYSSRKLAQTVITITQNPLDSLFPHLTVKENFLLAYRRLRNKKNNLMDVLEEQLLNFNPKLMTHLNTLCIHLSGGEQQALVLALACLAKPKILLLDEHTSALDPKTAENLMHLTQQKIKSNGITCMMTTHHLEHAQRFGDRLVALHQGKVLRDYTHSEKSTLSVKQIRKECYHV